jgi:tetratricopeptide (TPR) repeat protein
LRRGNNNKAQDYFERVVKLDSTNFNAIKQLANLYLISDKDSLSLVYLEKANLLNPIEADVAFDLANAYKKQKKYEPAYQILTVAITADTGNFILQQAKLPVAIELKKYNEVITIGEQLLKNDADANVVKNVGLAYYYLKSYQKAIDYLKMLEITAMETESTLYFTSLSYRALKDYKSATAYAKRTIEESISTNISSYYTLLGTVYEESEQFNAAASAYQKGLQYKTNTTIYYSLSLLYDLKLKQKSSALRYYNLYLKSKPDAKIEKAQIDFVKDRIVVLKSNK